MPTAAPHEDHESQTPPFCVLVAAATEIPAEVHRGSADPARRKAHPSAVLRDQPQAREPLLPSAAVRPTIGADNAKPDPHSAPPVAASPAHARECAPPASPRSSAPARCSAPQRSEEHTS